MPALSPTMESGTLTSWKIEVGKAFAAGDVLAEIQTDKASIDFVTEDDGFAARLFVADGEEVKVGDPVFLMVEEEEDCAAFKDFVLPSATAAAVVEPVAAVAAVPAPVVAAPEPIVQKPVTVASVAAAVEVVSPTPQPQVTTLNSPKGPSVNSKSPLVGLLSKRQKEYVELFGTTMQSPM